MTGLVQHGSYYVLISTNSEKNIWLLIAPLWSPQLAAIFVWFFGYEQAAYSWFLKLFFHE